MITNLVEKTCTRTDSNRRSIKRLAPASGIIRAQVTTRDDCTFEATVGDITSKGVRLLGELPLAVGDEIRLRIHLATTGGPYDTFAIVTNHDTDATGAHFTT